MRILLLILASLSFVIGRGALVVRAANSGSPPADAGVRDGPPSSVNARLPTREDLRASCEAGNGLSCRYLAEDLELASSGPRDERSAVSYYRKALERGHLNACNSGGMLLEKGSRESGVVEPDPTAAASMYDDGCRKGEAICCMSLADLYQTGKGVPKNKKRAAQLRKKAYRLGYAGE
jgi:TPR repeat protein